MATNRRLLLSLLAVAFLLFAATSLARAGSGSDFEDANPIRYVTDRDGSTESALLRVLGRSRHAIHFARFARRYGKRYESTEEMMRRFGIFVENLELIRYTNRKGLPYTLGINRFADWSWEEFQASRLGAAQNCSATLEGNHKLTDDAVLPETKDWREEGIVSPVKNQGHCGSCWTFSTTGALEAAYTQATGKSISLSEQQLVDCANAFNNFGCHGGLPSQAFEYIKYNGGLDTEESYPYTAANGICNFKPENVGVKVADSVNITLDVNHAVLAVGYGVEDGIPYWLIKNSWGEDWGLDGYFKMELGKNMCGKYLGVYSHWFSVFNKPQLHLTGLLTVALLLELFIYSSFDLDLSTKPFCFLLHYVMLNHMHSKYSPQP
ncbi:Cysteine proteinase 2 [Cocos nucifera]|uniref:Cysteine proteinase 2 n=1 Tax=Cocos nucifera TaxID=13894 RepID=A0A8K0N1T1_COCNU|nr:Cysteine proteinase 2 [Cocos nucifera]